MKMRLAKLATLAVLAVFSIAARGDWNAQVAVLPSGTHLLGNPAATTKLAEYISYTCSHCAEFDRQASDTMRLTYVRSGKLSIEYRHLVRDPVDMTAAMLTNCGPSSKFVQNHITFLRQQAQWMARIDNAHGQQMRWTTGTPLARRRAIADDLGFYRMMQARGYDRPTVDRCLADENMARKLADQTREASRLGVPGTPSFLINGELLAGTHSWPALQAQLKARI
jgi:protein-disulfide isomerase